MRSRVSLLVRRALRFVAARSVVLACACGSPEAEVFVAWIEADPDADLTRVLHVYDRGRRWQTTYVDPKFPGAAPTPSEFAVDDRGRGVAVFGDKERGLFALPSDGRTWSFSTASNASWAFLDGFAFTRNGDAILRPLFSPTNALALYAFVAGVEMPIVLAPPPPIAGGVMQSITASDAPVLYWLEQQGTPQHTQGFVQAIAYPSELGTDPRASAAPVVLASGSMETTRQFAGSLDASTCLGATCIAPTGRSATAMALDPCTVQWWRWPDDDDGESVTPQSVTLGPGCSEYSDPLLFAQIEDDLVVLDDAEQIHLGNLQTGAVTSGLKPWTGRARMLRALRGHALVFVSEDLQVVRVDGWGVRAINLERTACPTVPFTTQTHAAGMLTSPSGNWVLAWCNGGRKEDNEDTLFPPQFGIVYRISSLGFEVYAGAAMGGLGIDDDGNALLSSLDDDRRPRALFVLTGDGVLAPIDDLEPEPAAFAHPSGYSPFFALIDASQ